MNSIKLMLAAVLLGAFTLTVTGCPGKKEEVPAEAPAMDTMEEAGDEAAEAAPVEGTETPATEQAE